MFLEILRNSQKDLCQRFFFNEVAALSTETLLKKRLWHRCFPVSFPKSLTTPFLQNTTGRLCFYVCSFKGHFFLDYFLTQVAKLNPHQISEFETE